MNELDALLMRLARAPLPAGLASIEEGILARMAAGVVYRARRAISIATISAALAIGIVGSAMPFGEAATSLAPLCPLSPLSPAALLGGDQ